MTTFFADGGFFMLPLLLLALVVAGLAARNAGRIRRQSGPDPVLETAIDATLFWGGWAVLLGVLGTLIGVYRAAGVVEGGVAATPAAVWGGIRAALTTSLVGLAIFAAAALAWFLLRTGYRRRAVRI